MDKNKTVTKTGLVSSIQEKLGEGATKKCAECALSAVINSISEAVRGGMKVQLIGFGTFGIKERAARKGHNPRTHATIQIPASRALAFKASSTFVLETPKAKKGKDKGCNKGCKTSAKPTRKGGRK